MKVMIEWMQRKGYKSFHIEDEVMMALRVFARGEKQSDAARALHVPKIRVSNAFRKFREFWLKTMYPVLVNPKIAKAAGLKSIFEDHELVDLFFGESLVGGVDCISTECLESTDSALPSKQKNFVVVDPYGLIVHAYCGIQANQSDEDVYDEVEVEDYESPVFNGKPFKYYAADSGFRVNMRPLLVPFKGLKEKSREARELGTVLRTPCAIFNSYQKTYRKAVINRVTENSLPATFGILTSQIPYQYSDALTAIYCSFALHNFCKIFPFFTASIEELNKFVDKGGNVIYDDEDEEENDNDDDDNELSDMTVPVPCMYWPNYRLDWKNMSKQEYFEKAKEIYGGDLAAKRFVDFVSIQEQLFTWYIAEESLSELSASETDAYTINRRWFIAMNMWKYYYENHHEKYPDMQFYREEYYR